MIPIRPSVDGLKAMLDIRSELACLLSLQFNINKLHCLILQARCTKLKQRQCVSTAYVSVAERVRSPPLMQEGLGSIPGAGRLTQPSIAPR
jgi:hypothetical protein